MKKFTNLVLASALMAAASSPSLTASSSAYNPQEAVVQIIQDDPNQPQNMGSTAFQSPDSQASANQVNGNGANLDDDGGDDEKPTTKSENSDDNKASKKDDIFGKILGAVADRITKS
jgi:hypothetical protein